jgi:hypothetical protein
MTCQSCSPYLDPGSGQESASTPYCQLAALRKGLTFATETRLLDAAERNGGLRDRARVGADLSWGIPKCQYAHEDAEEGREKGSSAHHADLQSCCNAVQARNVLGEEVPEGRCDSL